MSYNDETWHSYILAKEDPSQLHLDLAQNNTVLRDWSLFKFTNLETGIGYGLETLHQCGKRVNITRTELFWELED